MAIGEIHWNNWLNTVPDVAVSGSTIVGKNHSCACVRLLFLLPSETLSTVNISL